jgi:hypothetical protein
MIMRVKYKTKPGQQFVVRREVYRRIEEAFREKGIEFAHRNVTVYLPPDASQTSSSDKEVAETTAPGTPDRKIIEAGAAAAIAAIQAEESEKKPSK